MDTTLSKPETDTLTTCERIIEAGKQTFLDVGIALLKIRDGRLYRATHKTFEEYCRQRWGWSRQRANQQIAAAEVVSNLTTVVVKTELPKTESVARPLAALPPPQQRQAWAKATETAKAEARPVTAKDTERAAKDVKPFLGTIVPKTKAPRRTTKPCAGMFLAGGAIRMLEKISLDDQEFREAMEEIIKWATTQLERVK